jgi:hypothetical protein
MIDSNLALASITTTKDTMFSFLKTGDIYNTLKTVTNLPGLFTSDGSKIKYALLNHSTAMRKNLSDGSPIFTNIRQWEAEYEQRGLASIASGRLSSMAAATATATFNGLDNELRIDNAALALIMAKELTFLNRTILMISLIAARYYEEQEDLAWGREDQGDDDGADDGADNGVADDETPSCAVLRRTQSDDNRDNELGVNQLSATFLISSSQLRRKINQLCALVGTSDILLNGMTTMDRPHNEANREKQILAERLVISDIFLHFCKFDAEHRDPVVAAFLELRDISVTAWRVLSMFAFSNMFRFLEGSEFAKFYQPDDAIFTQGRDYRLKSRLYEKEGVAAVMQFPTDATLTTAVEGAMAQATTAQMEEEDAPAYD